jgi:hypothetical protein
MKSTGAARLECEPRRLKKAREKGLVMIIEKANFESARKTLEKGSFDDEQKPCEPGGVRSLTFQRTVRLA